MALQFDKAWVYSNSARGETTSLQKIQSSPAFTRKTESHSLCRLRHPRKRAIVSRGTLHIVGKTEFSGSVPCLEVSENPKALRNTRAPWCRNPKFECNIYPNVLHSKSVRELRVYPTLYHKLDASLDTLHGKG